MRPAERDALVALYNNTDGDNWTNRTGWLLSDDPCGWFGVSCSGRQVWQVVLDDNNLTGSIPAELGDLTNLATLLLGKNNLTGPIPVELGNLTALITLVLRSNDLTGPIPVELANLTALITLWLQDNNLTGPIPVELGNLTNLDGFLLNSGRATEGRRTLPLSHSEVLRWPSHDVTRFAVRARHWRVCPWVC